jgi:hypothetical protein
MLPLQPSSRSVHRSVGEDQQINAFGGEAHVATTAGRKGETSVNPHHP